MSTGEISEHPWRGFLARRARFLVLLSAAVTLAGWLGAFHWFLELFSHFVAWYALGSLVLAVFLALIGRHRWAAAAGLLCILQVAAPLSWYLPSGATPAGPTHCRVLLANVLSVNQDTASFLALVKEVDPDIICVQEVTERWQRELAPLEAEYTVHAEAPRPDNFGIALFSRLPGPLPEFIYGGEAANSLVLKATVVGREVALLNLHAVPPMGRRMSDLRRQELDRARQWLDAQTGPAILMGDLNLTMYSPVYRDLVHGSALKNARAGHGPLGTWPSGVPILRLPLDQCLVKGLDVVDCRTVYIPGSDHRGLVVDIALSAE